MLPTLCTLPKYLLLQKNPAAYSHCFIKDFCLLTLGVLHCGTSAPYSSAISVKYNCITAGNSWHSYGCRRRSLILHQKDRGHQTIFHLLFGNTCLYFRLLSLKMEWHFGACLKSSVVSTACSATSSLKLHAS